VLVGAARPFWEDKQHERYNHERYNSTPRARRDRCNNDRLRDCRTRRHGDSPGQRNTYVVTPLVSDLAGKAKFQDQVLQNSWGVAFTPAGSPFWIADTTLYDGTGVKQGLQVSIPLPGNVVPREKNILKMVAVIYPREKNILKMVAVIYPR
jgi:hypothetical protein